MYIITSLAHTVATKFQHIEISVKDSFTLEKLSPIPTLTPMCPLLRVKLSAAAETCSTVMKQLMWDGYAINNS